MRQPDWKRSPPWVIQLREVGSNARRGASVLRVATEADAAPWLAALNSTPRVPPPIPPRRPSLVHTHQQPSNQGDDAKATAGKTVTRRSIEEAFDSLSVSFVPNGSLHCQALSDGLMWNASITSLSLCRMQLGLEGLQVLAHSLKSHPVLRHLELSGNCFGPECGASSTHFRRLVSCRPLILANFVCCRPCARRFGCCPYDIGDARRRHVEPWHWSPSVAQTRANVDVADESRPARQ